MPNDQDENIVGETKNERFVRLANSRLRKAVEAIRTMQNLGSSNYESTEEQRTFILEALDKEITVLETALKNGGVSDDIPQLETRSH